MANRNWTIADGRIEMTLEEESKIVLGNLTDAIHHLARHLHEQTGDPGFAAAFAHIRDTYGQGHDHKPERHLHPVENELAEFGEPAREDQGFNWLTAPESANLRALRPHLEPYERDTDPAGYAKGGLDPRLEVPEDRRPHSRACGIRRHDHGPECAPDCPTCHPQDLELAGEEGRPLDLQSTTDAQMWAREFMRMFGARRTQIDEGLMLGWFANAIEVGRSAGANPDLWGPHEKPLTLDQRVALEDSAQAVADRMEADRALASWQASRIADLEAGNASRNDRIRHLEGRHRLTARAIRDAEKRIADLESRLADALGMAEAVHQVAREAHQAAEALTDEVQVLKDEVNRRTSQRDALQADLDQKNRQALVTRSDLEVLQARERRYQQDIRETNERGQAIASRLSAAQATVSELARELEQAKAKIAEYETDEA